MRNASIYLLATFLSFSAAAKLTDCESQTTPELRKLMRDFYLIKRSQFKDSTEITKKLSKLMAMMVKESSGNTCSVSDMKGRGSYQSYSRFFKKNNSKGVLSRSHKVDLNLCRELMNLSEIKIDKQTNFGLAQISADRYVMDSRGGDELRGFFSFVAKRTSDEILMYCQSKQLFSDSSDDLKKHFETKKNCTPGIRNSDEIKCIGNWLTHCPTLNLEIALAQPMSYFETKSARPICHDLFKVAEAEYMASRLKEVKDKTQTISNPPEKDCCN